jgi:hypothetical protein
VSFNRTLLELKPEGKDLVKRTNETFNRTLLELKPLGAWGVGVQLAF